jgi:hypothetical protein
LHGDDTLSWVAVYLGECSYLHHLGHVEPCLLSQLTSGGIVGRLVDIHKSAGEGPATLAGSMAALDEQHL